MDVLNRVFDTFQRIVDQAVGRPEPEPGPQLDPKDLSVVWESEPDVSMVFDAQKQEYEADPENSFDGDQMSYLYDDLSEWELCVLACIFYIMPEPTVDHCVVSYSAVADVARNRKGLDTSIEKIKEGIESLEDKGYIECVREDGVVRTYVNIPMYPEIEWCRFLDMDEQEWRENKRPRTR